MKSIGVVLALFSLLGCGAVTSPGVPALGAKPMRGQFNHDGTDYFVTDLPASITPAIARQRLRRYANFWNKTEMLTGPNAMMVSTDSDKKFCAYVGGPKPVWVMAQCYKTDWKDAFRHCPDVVVASLATLSSREAITKESGQVDIGHNILLDLPEPWYQLDEALGGSPEGTTGILKLKDTRVFSTIEYVRTLEKSGTLKYGHFSVGKVYNGLRPMSDQTKRPIGFAIPRKEGFILLYNRMSPASEIPSIEKLARNFLAQKK